MSQPDFSLDVTSPSEIGSNGQSFGEEINGGSSKVAAMAAAAEANGGAAQAVAVAEKDKDTTDRKLFVGGLSWETKEEDLDEYFGKFGEIESTNLKLNPMTGQSRCFAFVVYKDTESLAKCIEQGEHAINSKKVDVKKAKSKPGKIFVGGLPPESELSEDALREHFGQYGTVTELELPMDKAKGERKKFGFVTFEKEETMKELVKMKQVMIGEVQLDVKKAQPKNDFSQGGFGGGGGWYGDFGYGGGYDFYGGGGGWGYGGGDFGYGGGGGGGGGGWGGGGYGGGKWSQMRGGKGKRGGGAGGGGAPY